MPPEWEEVRAWVEKAQRDRRTAEAALAQDPPITDTAGFHVQQAIEKLLKAYLVWRGEPFERIHDLEALADHCSRLDPTFMALVPRVAPITAYAVRFRYPGPGEPTLAEVQGVLTVLDEVYKVVSGLLPPELCAIC